MKQFLLAMIAYLVIGLVAIITMATLLAMFLNEPIWEVLNIL